MGAVMAFVVFFGGWGFMTFADWLIQKYLNRK